MQVKIWTIKYWIRRTSHKVFLWFVWKLPRTVIYWAFIRVWAHGTSGEYGATSPDDLTWHEALKRWGD